jgi:hypothetical protein
MQASKDDIQAGLTRDAHNNQIFGLSLGGCVNYSFPSDPDCFHQTRFLYDVRMPNRMPIHLGDEAIDVLLSAETFFGAGRWAD